MMMRLIIFSVARLALQPLGERFFQCGLALILRFYPFLGLVAGNDGRLTVSDDYFVGGHYR